MAQGTNYEDKQQLLLEGIQELVYKNGKGAIDGEANQKALKNLAETFWGPEDGKPYARKDGKWDEVSNGSTLDVYNQDQLLSALNNTDVERINIAKSFSITGLDYGLTINLGNVSKSIYGLPLIFGNKSSIWFETQDSANVKVYSDIVVLNTSSEAGFCENPYTTAGTVNLFFRNILNDNFFLAGQNSFYELAKNSNSIEGVPAGSPSPQGFWDNTFRDTSLKSYTNIELDNSFNNTTYSASSFQKIYTTITGVGQTTVELPVSNINDFDRIIISSYSGAVVINYNNSYLDKIYAGGSIIYEYNSNEAKWSPLASDRIFVKTLETEAITNTSDVTKDERKAYTFKGTPGSSTTITLIDGTPTVKHVGKWSFFHRQNNDVNPSTLNLKISSGSAPFGKNLNNIAMNSFVSFEVVEFLDPDLNSPVYYPVNIVRSDAI